MPLLKREPDIWPDDLFELSVEDFPWQVAHVRSRQEKTLARHLVPREVAGAHATPAHLRPVPFYMPLVENRLKGGGRIRTSWIPLFGGYVFFRGKAAERLRVLQSGVVVGVLPVADQPLLGHELRQIHELQLKGARLIPYPELAPGDAVRIREGVFAGYEGVILKEKGEARLVVSVTMLAKAVLVELDREALAPAR
ncbi:MAG: hypothetical protein WA208_07590 [Thermoanaerobaculia bacterium]